MKVPDSLLKEAQQYAETHVDVIKAYIAGAQRKVKKNDLSFVRSDFIEVFSEWLEYKGNTYKTPKSLQICYKKLLELSNNNPDTAKRIVENSIANGWKGIFALRNNEQRQIEQAGPTLHNLAAKIANTVDY